jgi:PAS domain S-box-containing protein
MPLKNNTAKTASSLQSAELERERLISLINSMADGVIATDHTGRIVLYNGAALNTLDVNAGLHGKYFNQVTTIVDANNQAVDITKMILETQTQTTNRDLRLVYPDASKINLYISIAPVKLGFGKDPNKGFVILVRDITREKSLEEERDEFIGVVSHELRTPIAIAEGNVANAQYIVDKMPGNEPIKKALEQAHEQILFLGGMINDLATLSRAEGGKLNLTVEAINAHQLIEELAHEFTREADQKDLEIKTDLDPELELLQSNKLYLHEILQNFITNAIKYTEKGSVTISARPHQKGVIFEISDTGIGISQADQERVYDKFFRSEDFRTRKHNGTGLGLYVTMKLTRLIHAEMSLESELDKGSTFSLYVPNLK